jgi:hypothetical protein
MAILASPLLGTSDVYFTPFRHWALPYYSPKHICFFLPPGYRVTEDAATWAPSPIV